ncbi:hypothetical protein HJD18_12675 [Thermoleophilia bacterium SCSIO 60948]|nr:hypothetical protein HJD18_12675 [Thermoleophilia bacterium SCSIO 60948]
MATAGGTAGPGGSRDERERRIEAAVQALAEGGGIAEAEATIAVAAPGLQRILAHALSDGGWFGEPHDDAVRKVAAIDDEAERATAIATLLAEETRLGMMVGAAVGFALARELETGEDPPTGPERRPEG